MDNDEYFELLNKGFEREYRIASEARKKGFDPKDSVEIIPAPDIASKVEGIIGVKGIADIIRKNVVKDARTKSIFDVVKEICTSESFSSYTEKKRIELSVRVGLAIITEGVLVAPTEGISGVEIYKNYDSSTYLAISFAGPIRGAGGTSAAMSVAIGDYARRLFGIGEYKATQDEIERYVEEAEIYDARAARLQYKPSDDDLRIIAGNIPVCVDGVPTEDIEANRHRDLKRIDANGKEQRITNRIRGGVSLVMCEGIAQKAKKLVKEVKQGNLDWSWLNGIIKVEKGEKKAEDKDAASFLDDLVAGRPILAFPRMNGGFRLRYGRSRFSGIAAKGFNPATMIITDGFMAVGTQLKMEVPGKGCVVVPVDSIEGPFVVLDSGEALRVNDATKALEIRSRVREIISLGDILVTYGDFKKSNAPLQPSSYVEEFWLQELKEKAGSDAEADPRSFREAYDISIRNSIPMHPRYLLEFAAVTSYDMSKLSECLCAFLSEEKKGLFELDKISLKNTPEIKRTLELLNLPHKVDAQGIIIEKDNAQALVASLGILDTESATPKDSVGEAYKEGSDVLELLNIVSPFKIMNRSTYIAARIGRPEKAKERLMKPAPNVLFPIGEYGGKERNIMKAYVLESKKLGESGITVDLPTYLCGSCKREIDSPFCYDCSQKAASVRKCPKCGTLSDSDTCPKCGTEMQKHTEKRINIVKKVNDSMKMLNSMQPPHIVKGMKGMSSAGKNAEPLEKGIIRAQHGVYIFKDGTSRFDATDVPITHFYPSEIGTSVEKLRSMGYDKDYLGNELVAQDQLVELKHQDVIMNTRGGEYLLKTAKAVDSMLERLYKMERFYNAASASDLIGKYVITLAPHISCGIMNRIIGFTEANVGFAHPYTICARRRNCDGDEDTTMLLLDALINFSRSYLPSSVGGTMDAPLILTLNVDPEEVDDEVHAMDIVERYGLDFYRKTMSYPPPSEAEQMVELVNSRLKKGDRFSGLLFSHMSSASAIKMSPKKSHYTELKTMQEKVDAEFDLIDKIRAVDKRSSAKKLIICHFIPDLIGNLNSFSKQTFRCVSCSAKYRRIPMSGKCTRDGGKLLLTISKGGIEKYLDMAIALADRYDLEPYMKQRLGIVKKDINNMFGQDEREQKQFNLAKFM